MLFTKAEGSIVDTLLAEIVIAIIAGAAVIVDIRNGLSALVAVD